MGKDAGEITDALGQMVANADVDITNTQAKTIKRVTAGSIFFIICTLSKN
jgi:hypothetical protein